MAGLDLVIPMTYSCGNQPCLNMARSGWHQMTPLIYCLFSTCVYVRDMHENRMLRADEKLLDW